MLSLSALQMIAMPALLAALAATPDVIDPTPNESALRAAVSRSLPLLVAGAQGAVAHSRQCFMCHNQALPVLALTTAGFPTTIAALAWVDEVLAADS